MDAAELRALQAPIKQGYRDDPTSARVPAHAEARLGAGVTCTVAGWSGETVAGLHPAAGGDGSKACSADMLLEALVACAGVTLNSVATVMGVNLRNAVVRADGHWDARGTLGVSKEVPIGLIDIELTFELDTDADEKTRTKLIELTERYCAILQTLRNPPRISWRIETGS
jgi:uncharacterized OsmC-like protein